MPLNTGPSVTCSVPFSSDIDSSSGASSSSFSVEPSSDSEFLLYHLLIPGLPQMSKGMHHSKVEIIHCKSHVHRHRRRNIFLSMWHNLTRIRYVWEVMLFCLLCCSVTYNNK